MSMNGEGLEGGTESWPNVRVHATPDRTSRGVQVQQGLGPRPGAVYYRYPAESICTGTLPGLPGSSKPAVDGLVLLIERSRGEIGMSLPRIGRMTTAAGPCFLGLCFRSRRSDSAANFRARAWSLAADPLTGSPLRVQNDVLRDLPCGPESLLLSRCSARLHAAVSHFRNLEVLQTSCWAGDRPSHVKKQQRSCPVAFAPDVGAVSLHAGCPNLPPLQAASCYPGGQRDSTTCCILADGGGQRQPLPKPRFAMSREPRFFPRAD